MDEAIVSSVAKTFSLVECGEINDAEIVCKICRVSFGVIIHEPFIHEWKRYKNPNAWDIECYYSHLKKYVEICPEAIMAVASTIPNIPCPICQADESLWYTPYSTYDPQAILESLKVPNSKV